MQPSSAFSILKQLTPTGKQRILDKMRSSAVARDPQSVMNSVALGDFNRDRSASPETAFKKLKSKGTEARVVSTVEDVLSVDKENMCDQCVDDTDDSVTHTSALVELKQLMKQNLSNDGLDESDVPDGCDAAGVKQYGTALQQRKTFSLKACNSLQLPVQSDSIDVVNLITEVADVYRRSSELSYSNTDDISTQEIEAHEDKFDGLKQQSIENTVPVHQHCMHSTSLQPVSNIDVDEQRTEMSWNSDVVLEPAVVAGCWTATATELLHSVPLPPALLVKAVQNSDVSTPSMIVQNDIQNSSPVLPNNTNGHLVSVSSDDIQQAFMPSVSVDVGVCLKSKSPADNKDAHYDKTDALDTDVDVAANNCETKQMYSEEVFISHGDDRSDAYSESGK